jgi:opacity protein-like surface antigen
MKTTTIFRYGLVLLISSGLAAGSAFAQVTQFEIDVPKRGSGPGSKPVFIVDARININGSGDLDVRVTDPESNPVDLTLAPGDPYDFDNFPTPSGAPGNDVAAIAPIPPSTSDPLAREFQLTLTLGSNRGTTGGECQDVMPGVEETFTIEITSGQPITGVCLSSFDETGPIACEDIEPIDPLVDLPVATVDGPGIDPDPACGLFRPAVDVALVLDKSGSMSGSLPTGGPSSTKMTALRNAVTDFVQRWETIRTSSLHPETGAPDDEVAIVPFNGNVVCSGLPGAFCDSSGGTVSTPLVPLNTTVGGVPVPDAVANSIPSLTPGGSTSIGDGLHQAGNLMTLGDGHRKVVLIMSDGRENSHRRVRLTDSSGDVMDWDAPTWNLDNVNELVNVELGAGDDWDPMPNEVNLKVYSVTLGPAGSIKPAVNHGIARATGGFYINSENDDASILSMFFIELLQNFVKFNTWETVRITSATVAVDANGLERRFDLPFPLSSTTKAVSLDVSWNPALGNICADITPPGVSDTIEECGDGGKLSWESVVPFPETVATTDDWGLVFRPDNVSSPNVGETEIPFYAIVNAEDSRLNSEVKVLPGDYVASDPIPVQMKLTEGYAPITGLSNVTATIATPGESIGQLLADSAAGTTPPNSDDDSGDADSMLDNAIAADSDLIQFARTQIPLFDDGAHNDEQANDGIYGGEFFSDAPGHYHILFSAEGDSEHSARFARQQLLSTVVRAFPDDLFVTVTSQVGDNNVTTHRLVMKPQTSNGHLLGPGWGSYFWFDPPNSDPVKPRDNLDGTYSATFTDGPVPLHFLNIAQVLDDDTTFDDLPVELDDDNELTGDACDRDCVGQGGRWSVSAALGPNDPSGSFGNVVDGSWGFDLGVQYAFNPQWAVELAFGQDMFDGKSGIPDVDIQHLKLNGKSFFPIGSNRGFASVGYGSYNFDPGPTEQGFNLGVGYQFDLAPRWNGEAKLNYHDIDASGVSINFYTLQIGLRYNF